MTDHSPSHSSQAISGSIDPKISAGEGSEDTILERCLNLLEDLTYEAVGTEEGLNPSEYEVPAEIVERANQILADSEEEF